jgi:hypothetical protein
MIIIIICAQFLSKPPVYYEWAIIMGVEISAGQYKTVLINKDL